MKYQKRFTLENGDFLSIVCNAYSYGGEDGLFEVAWNIAGEFQEPLGYLTFEHVAEILSQHKFN